MIKDLKKREKVADIIQSIRVQKGYTQQQLADLSGTTQKTVSRIENGEFSPNLDLLYAFLSALDVKLKINNIEI